MIYDSEVFINQLKHHDGINRRHKHISTSYLQVRCYVVICSCILVSSIYSIFLIILQEHMLTSKR
jgi:hypothetical protein